MSDPKENRIDQCHAYFDGRLDVREADAFLAELQHNPALRHFFEQLQSLDRVLGDMPLQEAPARIEYNIMQAITAEPQPLSVALPVTRRKIIRLPIKAAAAILLVGLTGSLLMLQPGQQTTPQPKVVAQAEAPDQEVEQPLQPLQPVVDLQIGKAPDKQTAELTNALTRVKPEPVAISVSHPAKSAMVLKPAVQSIRKTHVQKIASAQPAPSLMQLTQPGFSNQQLEQEMIAVWHEPQLGLEESVAFDESTDWMP